jgi:hypothetical protein
MENNALPGVNESHVLPAFLLFSCFHRYIKSRRNPHAGPEIVWIEGVGEVYAVHLNPTNSFMIHFPPHIQSKYFEYRAIRKAIVNGKVNEKAPRADTLFLVVKYDNPYEVNPGINRNRIRFPSIPVSLSK